MARLPVLGEKGLATNDADNSEGHDAPKDEAEYEALAGEFLAGGFLWDDEHKLVEVREVPHVPETAESGQDAGHNESVGALLLPTKVVNETEKPDETEEEKKADECWVHKLTIDELFEVTLTLCDCWRTDDAICEPHIAPRYRERVTLANQIAVPNVMFGEKECESPDTDFLSLGKGLAAHVIQRRSSDSHRDNGDG